MPFTFADLFAGIGGFHAVLAHAGGECVFMSEIDQEAATIYKRNWLTAKGENNYLNNFGRPVVVNTDVNLVVPDVGDLVGVPEGIDILTAGFPCQPFSKSGYQEGMREARGTLFWSIARFLEERQPQVILLENVRNLVGPRHLHEWDVIVHTLRDLGYRVSATPTIFSPHLLPPSLGGTPQVRDRVFILGTFVGKGNAPDPAMVPPTLSRQPVASWDPQEWDVCWALDDEDEIAHLDRYELSTTERGWIDFWDELVQKLPIHKERQRLPGFPLWAEHWESESSLDPSYLESLPDWKRSFVIKNARYYEANRAVMDQWLADARYKEMPVSRRKLEWQAQDSNSLWETVMHFRPSGIRCKKPTYLPALVAITQTSVIGPRERRLTPHEAARLQGLAQDFSFGRQRDSASYKQVGNGVCVGAAWYVLCQHVRDNQDAIPERIVHAVLGAGLNPSLGALSHAAHDFESKRLVREPRP